MRSAYPNRQACNAGTSCQSSKEKARRNPHEVDAGQERGKQEAALELRLLRYFVAVAEELHFARAAERLGVEQSPVSRAMRNLEATLGVQLFDRSAHQTRLTWAGQVFLGECRRVLATVEQAVSAAKAAAQGYQGYLRIAICDSLAQPHIATLLARSREEEPELEIRVFELPRAAAQGPAQRSAGHRLCAVGRGERRPCRRARVDRSSVGDCARAPPLVGARGSAIG